MILVWIWLSEELYSLILLGYVMCEYAVSLHLYARGSKEWEWGFLFLGFNCFFVLWQSTLNCRRAFWDKRISQEVVGDALGEVWFLAGNRQCILNFFTRNLKIELFTIITMLPTGIQRLCLQDHWGLWQTRISYEAGSVDPWSCSPPAP